MAPFSMNTDLRLLRKRPLGNGWRSAWVFVAILELGHFGYAFGGSPEESSKGDVVQLPPFVVSELPDGLPWRYVRIAEFEVITLAGNELTEAVVAALLRGQRFVSSALLGDRDAPVSVVLFDLKAGPLPATEVVSQNSRWRAGSTRYDGVVVQSEDGAHTFAANLSGLDRWPMVDFGPTRRLMMEAGGVPEWLSDGLFGSSGCLSELAGHRDSPAIELPSFLWVSEEESKELRSKRFRPPAMLPMAKLFGPAPDEELEPEVYRLWSSQAGLFARWQLFGKIGRPLDRLAFWGFALEARERSVDEATFQRWFRCSYADAEHEMLNYLRVAIASPEIIQVADVNRPLPELRNLKLRMATEEQVARLKGNFERMEANRLRRDFPELAEKYAAAARRTFQRGLKAQPASASLRGLLGQLEFDLGNTAAARPLLEYAFAQNALGTRALVALAKLRLDESRQGLAPEAKLPGGALERVLTPLFAARARKPPVLEVYQMIAEVWEQSAVVPTRGHLAVLLEGAQFFRDEADYITAAIQLHWRHGYEAGSLVALRETWARYHAARSLRACQPHPGARRRSDEVPGVVLSPRLHASELPTTLDHMGPRSGPPRRTAETFLSNSAGDQQKEIE